MTFEQLDYFIAAVKYDTFFDAAEVLHITQSTLSKQIMKLEKELEVTLLDRSRRKASLTEAGQMFYKEALNLSAQYHQTLLRVQEFRLSASQELHIGTLPILSQYQLTAMLKDFADQNPHIRFTLDEVEEHELLDGFSRNRYDIIITRSNMLDLNTHEFYPLAVDRLVAILPDNHALAGKSALSLQEIACERFILMHPYTSIYQLCMELFRQAGIKPDLIRTARMESIISAVAVHEGISLLPEENFRLFQYDNITSVPIDPVCKLSIGAGRKKSDSIPPAPSQFIRYAMSHKK